MAYISTNEDTASLSLTIYNGNFGVVKEQRKAALTEKDEVIQYLDVAEKIETDSIIVTGPKILELNYDYDLVNKQKLLEKYVGKTVFLSKSGHQEEYRLLSAANGIVLEKSDTKEIVGRAYFAEAAGRTDCQTGTRLEGQASPTEEA